jgi:hypothetical protein
MLNTQHTNRYAAIAVGLALGFVVATGHAAPNSQGKKTMTGAAGG